MTIALPSTCIYMYMYVWFKNSLLTEMITPQTYLDPIIVTSCSYNLIGQEQVSISHMNS